MSRTRKIELGDISPIEAACYMGLLITGRSVSGKVFPEKGNFFPTRTQANGRSAHIRVLGVEGF